ncbi:MAG: hypothetical protein LBU07_03570 [Coriobacteriales bacterium]|nr:hypothetical protein [Coriobacteriales bacterium]
MPALSPELKRILIPGADAHASANYARLAKRARDFSLATLEPEFVILDVETTGFSPQRDALIEIAAARIQGSQMLERFSTFVNPQQPIPEQITTLTTITNADVRDAPAAPAALAQLAEFCGNRPIIAHNAGFDQGFIQAALSADSLPSKTQALPPLLAAEPWIDSLELARIALPLLREHNLESLSAAFAPEKRSTHRAIDDVEALAVIWRVILVALGDLPAGLCAYYINMFPDTPWSSRSVLAMVAESQCRQAGFTRLEDAPPFMLHKVRTELTTALRRQPKVDVQQMEDNEHSLVPVGALELAWEYSPEGLLGMMYPNYEGRAEQLEMAQAVAEALNDSCFSAIEAGTGVGKSMAYLLPLALFAKRNGLTCGIATKTNALLDQLIYHELPRLDAALRQRFQGGEPASSSPDSVVLDASPTPSSVVLDTSSTDIAATDASPTPSSEATISGRPADRAPARNALGQPADPTPSAQPAGSSPGIMTATDNQDFFDPRASDPNASAPGLQYLMLKGYSHYPCLRKLLRATRRHTAYRGEPALLAQLLSYVCQSLTGDLDVVNLLWQDVPRFQVVASSEDCLRHRCAQYGACLLHNMRRQAKYADIVVTNHALLFLDAQTDGKLLPPVRHWVVDEAHAAEQEARDQFSRELDFRLLDETIKALLHPGGAARSLLPKDKQGDGDTLFSKDEQDDGDTLLVMLAHKVLNQAKPLGVLLESFGSYVQELVTLADASDYNQIELWINESLRQSVEWGQVLSSGRSLMRKLEALVGALRSLLEACEAYPQIAETQREVSSSLEGIQTQLMETLEVLGLVLDGANTNYVYSALLDRRGILHGGKLVASYYDVGAALMDDFYPQNSSVVYTSATIALGDNDRFGYFLRAMGLDEVPDERLRTLALGSSYDFDANMTVFVPTTMPEPNNLYQRSSYDDALEGLLFLIHTSLGGGVLTLFTNRRDMEEMYGRLKDRLQAADINLLCQFRGVSKTQLRERFIADERLSLFALRSFWEGFDAPGQTLRCVIIPKLPFGRPNDPLQREREARESRAWIRYSLPEAIISLKQAAGRLIRSSQDSGYLVLADKRLITKFYGQSFLSALPSANIHFLAEEEIAARMKKERG